MINFVALPLLLTIIAAISGSQLWGRLNPSLAARISSISLFSVMIAAVPTLWMMGLSGLSHLGLNNVAFDWSHHLLPEYEPFGTIVGLSSLALAVVGTVRVGRVLRTHRRLRCVDTPPVEIVASGDVFAYTLPGPARTVAISQGLCEALDEREFHVVLAHEQTHARHRHDLLLLLANVTIAFLPPMRPLAHRLQFFLERWADEGAAENTGYHRRFVAVTIAKVAMSFTAPASVGIAGHGAAARAQALLAPVETADRRVRLAVWLIAAVTVSQALSQLHHTVLFGTGLLG